MTGQDLLLPKQDQQQKRLRLKKRLCRSIVNSDFDNYMEMVKDYRVRH